MTTGTIPVLDKSSMETTTTAAPTIRVEIYNQTYNIRSDGDSEYLTNWPSSSTAACARFLRHLDGRLSEGCHPGRAAHRRRATPPQANA
jgi:hypothetical protein